MTKTIQEMSTLEIIDRIGDLMEMGHETKAIGESFPGELRHMEQELTQLEGELKTRPLDDALPF